MAAHVFPGRDPNGGYRLYFEEHPTFMVHLAKLEWKKGASDFMPVPDYGEIVARIHLPKARYDYSISGSMLFARMQNVEFDPSDPPGAISL